MIKERIERINKIDISSEKNVESLNVSLIDNNDENLLQAAISFLSKSTKGGHEIMRSSIIANFGITKEQLPSYYMMTKCYPEMMEFNVYSIDLLKLELDNSDINHIKVGEEDDSNNNIVPLTATSFINEEFSTKAIKLDDVFNQMSTSKKVVEAHKSSVVIILISIF